MSEGMFLPAGIVSGGGVIDMGGPTGGRPADSLQLGDLDLIPTSNMARPAYHLGDGYTFGNPKAVLTTLIGGLLDGDPVSGLRYGNRRHELPVHVVATTRLQLSTMVTALINQVRVDTVSLRWAPYGGLPLLWDCYRGDADVQWSQLTEFGFEQTVVLTFDAQPYGRSEVSPISPTLRSRATAGPNGSVWTVGSPVGSAPAPISMKIEFAAPVQSFVVHHPPGDADPDAPILTTWDDTAKVINAAPRAETGLFRFYGAAGALRGSYAVLLDMLLATAPAYRALQSVRAVNAYFDQYDSGPIFTAYRTAVSAPVRRLVDSVDVAVDMPGGRLVFAGNIVLPLISVPPEGGTTLTMFTTATGTVDSGGRIIESSRRWTPDTTPVPGVPLHAGQVISQTAMLLDTRGQTIVWNSPRRLPNETLTAGGLIAVWIDAPPVGTDLPQVYGQFGSPTVSNPVDRKRAVALTGLRVSGGPFVLDPNTINTLLTYSPEGHPTPTVSYIPRWLAERTE